MTAEDNPDYVTTQGSLHRGKKFVCIMTWDPIKDDYGVSHGYTTNTAEAEREAKEWAEREHLEYRR